MPFPPDDDDLLPDDTDPDSDYFSTGATGAGVPTAYTSGAALAPNATRPQTALPRPATPGKTTSQSLLDDANAIASKQNRQPTIMDGIMAGLAAKPATEFSSHGGTALMQGLLTGFTGGVQGRKRKDNDKEQFDMKYKLFQMNEKLDNDARSASDRERRTSAYERSVNQRGAGGTVRPMHPLQAQKFVDDGVNSMRKQLGLEADDEALPGAKMKPEKRIELERKVEERRLELQRLANGGQVGGGPAPTAPGTTTTAPQPTPTPTPGPGPTPVPTTRPSAKLPDGWDMPRAKKAYELALKKAGTPEAKAKVTKQAREMGIIP